MDIHDQKLCTLFSQSRTCSQVFELKKQIQEKIKKSLSWEKQEQKLQTSCPKGLFGPQRYSYYKS